MYQDNYYQAALASAQEEVKRLREELARAKDAVTLVRQLGYLIEHLNRKSEA